MQLEELTKNKPHLRALLEAMPNAIKERCIIKQYEPRSAMFHKNDPVDNIYIVCNGKFRVLNELPNGAIYGFAYVESRDFVGALELLAEKERIACTVEAVTNCDVISISKEDFLYWYNSDHNFTKRITKMLAEMFYSTSYKYGSVFMASPLVSMAKYISDNVEKKITQQKKARVLVTRQFMADELGVSLRTIYRAVKKLKENGWIEIINGVITITPEQYTQLQNFITEQT